LAARSVEIKTEEIMRNSNGSLDAHQRRQIATEALCDPGTVARYVAGEHVRGLSARRIVRALKKLGLTEHIRRSSERVRG